MAKGNAEGCKMTMWCLVKALVIIEYSVLVVRRVHIGNVVVYRVACTKWWKHLFVEVACMQ